jgi:spermidine/putrescine-binding protein
MNWFQKNFKTIIYVAFLVPIFAVAFVSISHVTTWYGLSNPLSWAIYLSIGIEIAALSALAAISAQMGKKVYFPFGIVTLIQFIGNIFFAYQYIDVSTTAFKDWVDLVDPIVSYLGVESGDPIGHKRFLALFSGGMLPIISLSFLHMLVKFEEEEKKKEPILPTDIDIDELSIEAGKIEAKYVEDKYVPTEEELKRLEEELIKLNEQKFGTLEGPTGTDGHDDSGVDGIKEPQKKTGYFPEKKVLNYLRRDA